MIQEVMTVHKALCELKMLDKRINESIMSAEFCRANKHSNVKIDGGTIAEYEAAAVSKYQSTMDMIIRRDAIKRAAVASNAVTEVTIGGERGQGGGGAGGRAGARGASSALHCTVGAYQMSRA